MSLQPILHRQRWEKGVIKETCVRSDVMNVLIRVPVIVSRYSVFLCGIREDRYAGAS